MMRRMALVAICAALAGACSSSSDRSAPTSSPAPRASTTTLDTQRPTANSSAAEWAVYGHDLANSRANVNERAITRATVANLNESWSTPGLVGVTGSPSVAGGVAYFGDWTGTAHAVKADTGAEIWSQRV